MWLHEACGRTAVCTDPGLLHSPLRILAGENISTLSVFGASRKRSQVVLSRDVAAMEAEED